MSVTRGQCDTRPTVTFPATRHHRSPPSGWYQIILLGDRHMCVNNFSRVVLDSGEARIRTRDLLIASPASYDHSATEPQHSCHKKLSRADGVVDL